MCKCERERGGGVGWGGVGWDGGRENLNYKLECECLDRKEKHMNLRGQFILSESTF